MRYTIRERFFRLGEDSDITDESGRPVLRVDGKVFSLHDTLIVRDPAGAEVARVQRKLLALRPTYEITAAGRHLAEVRKHLFTPFVDRFAIDVPGPDDMQLDGSLLDHEFTIRRGDRAVARVSKQWFTLRDTYGVDIAEGEDWLRCWRACWRSTSPRTESTGSTDRQANAGGVTTAWVPRDRTGDRQSIVAGLGANAGHGPASVLLLVGNSDADPVVPFGIDQSTGALAPTGAVTQTPVPVAFAFGGGTH